MGVSVISLTNYIHHWIGLYWSTVEGRAVIASVQDEVAVVVDTAKSKKVAATPADFTGRLSTGDGATLRERLLAITPLGNSIVFDMQNEIENYRVILCAGDIVVGRVSWLFSASGMPVPTDIKLDTHVPGETKVLGPSSAKELDINSLAYTMPFVSF